MKGLWLNKVFLKTLGAHYTTLHGDAKIPVFGEPKSLHPIGAMGLCAASVVSIKNCNHLLFDRSNAHTHFGRPELSTWRIWPAFQLPSRLPQESQSMASRRRPSYNQPNSSTHQTKYSKSAARIKDASWDTIISSAWSFAKSSHKPPSSAELIVIDDNEPIYNFNPHANMVEESDSE